MQAENEQLGKEVSEGRIQKVRAEAAMHKGYAQVLISPAACRFQYLSASTWPVRLALLICACGGCRGAGIAQEFVRDSRVGGAAFRGIRVLAGRNLLLALRTECGQKAENQ